jgi:O-antigen/teichoic acid export membrane protein
MGNGLKKFIPEFRAENDSASIKGAVLSSLYITLPLSIILWAIIFFGAEFIAINFFDSKGLIPLIKILSFTIPIGVVKQTFYDTTLAFNKIIYKVASVRIIQNIVQLGVTVGLLLLGYNVVSAAWGWLVGGIVALLLGFYVVERKIGPILFSDVKPKYRTREMLRFSSPLVISGLIGTLMGWADTGFLGYYMTNYEVGLYNAALPTAMLILLPHKAIGSLSLTSFSELKEKNRDKVQDSIRTASYWIFSLVFPTFLIMLLYSEQVLKVLFGSQYGKASLALSILAVGYLVDTLVGKVGSYLQAEGHSDYFLYNNIAALTLNVLLNFILIPKFGITGAAIATASSTALSNILLCFEAWKKEKVITIPKKLYRVVIAGIIPLLVVIGIDSILFVNTPFWFLFPAAIIYYGVYFISFLNILGLGQEEKEVFLRIGEIIEYEEEVEYILKKVEGLFGEKS